MVFGVGCSYSFSGHSFKVKSVGVRVLGCFCILIKWEVLKSLKLISLVVL